MSEQRRREKWAPELHDRAVRMVFEGEAHCEPQWETIRSVADKLGADGGDGPGLATAS